MQQGAAGEIRQVFGMQSNEIPENFKSIIKNTARKLKGAKRREYLAEITIAFFNGNARKAERVFGWGRETINKGIREMKTGIICMDNFSARGNKRTEEKSPELLQDIQRIIRNGNGTRRISARAVRKALIDNRGYRDDDLPCEKTIANILQRSGLKSNAVF